MRKEKVIELRIEEDDELSGVDAISLVDEPAIEVNWVAFKKVEENFHIPEGEDEKYLSYLNGIGESEEELFKDGWKIHSIDYDFDKEDFESSPNAKSALDNKSFKTRFKYAKNPDAPGPIVKNTTRDFCRKLVADNLVYRKEDLKDIKNDFGNFAKTWRGGYNCRHLWQRIVYYKDVDIANDASDTKGRLNIGPSYTIPGIKQPDTRVMTHPSFNKSSFEIDENNVNVFGYHTRFFQLCPSAQELFKHLVSMEVDEETVGMIRSAAQVADNVFRIEYEVISAGEASQHQYEEAVLLVEDFKDILYEIDEITQMQHDVSFMDGHIEKIVEYLKEDLGYDVTAIGGYIDPSLPKKKKKKFESYNDYPDSAKNNACKVIKWRDEHGDEVKGMTRIGWTRASQLCGGENISEETIARMSAFARHRKNAEVAAEYKDTPWKDAGYVAWLGWGGTTGVEWAQKKLQSIRNEKMSKQKFEIDNEDKRVIVGPAMLPDMLIPRVDEEGKKYSVWFSKDTIKMIAEKYMRNKYLDNNDLDHNGKAVKDVYVVESWIIEDEENDKSKKYGYELPVGTWMVMMKVAKTPTGDMVWERIKKGQLRGFSVSGFFSEIEQFAKENLFLQKVAEIIKKYE